MIGIYQIQSKIEPKRIYIGGSINIKNRWSVHINELRRNKHHSCKLQNHFNKYGESDLQFSVLLECTKFDLIINEQLLLDFHKPYFNNRKIAENNLGIKWSFESRQKIIGRKGSGPLGKHWTLSEESLKNRNSKEPPKKIKPIKKISLRNRYDRYTKEERINLINNQISQRIETSIRNGIFENRLKYRELN